MVFRKFILLLLVAGFSQSFYSQLDQKAEGFWMSRGYGWVAEINQEFITLHDISKSACNENLTYPISMLSKNITVKDKVLIMKRGVTEYTFDSIDKLPDLCVQKLSKKKCNDPFYNFETLWNTFNEQYVYFEERNVNWDSIYSKYRKRVHEKMSQAELFVVFDEMLETFDDGHVDIEPSEKVMKKVSALKNENIEPEADFRSVRQGLVAAYIEDPNFYNLTRVVWGNINKKVGYVQLNGMQALSNYGVTQDMSSKEATKIYRERLSESADPLVDQLEGTKFAFNKVIKDLKDTEAIILDLRFNGGGEDMVGLTALSHFINEEKVVFTKKHRINDSFSDPYDFILKPEKNNYLGKLYILQSHWSASAAEILLLASLSYDTIERIGSTSEGIFSDILPKKLPNGWEFGLSNQVYQDADGVNYETRGIPVHKDLKYSKNEYEFVLTLKEQLDGDKDPAIEYVLNKVLESE